MGPKIIIPVILVILVVPILAYWAKQRFRGDSDPAVVVPPAGRLTSNALRDLPSPPWRVVYEIAPDKLGGIEHVLIGPSGAFALTTSLDPLPAPVADGVDADPHALARVAIVRGGLDDALRRCAMSSTALVIVHWGPTADGAPISVATVHGVIAVEGRRLADWAARQADGSSSAAQVDLAWQTVVTSIGRPDPLA